MVDVDDTLILWDGKHNSPGEGKHIVQQKVSDGTTAEFYFHSHRAHLQAILALKERGYYVIVWSARGAAWAQAVVCALELQDFVDDAMAKPTCYFDDKPVEQWFGPRIYIPEGK